VRRGRWAGEFGGREGTDRWAQVVVTVAREMVMGRLRKRLGREALQRWAGAEKTARDPFSNLINQQERIKIREILGDLRKM
jgi:hypothetical protein